MAQYYFDLRDDGTLAVDEEGMDLPNLAAAQAEAAQALADIVRNAAREIAKEDSPRVLMTIEVRDDNGPVLQVKYIFEVHRLN